MKYETVIGLEIHSELATNTKIYCSCANEFGGDENPRCCPVCIGLPGVLPVLNKKVVEYCMKAGLAMNCEISHFSKQDRKNYFIPIFQRLIRFRSLICLYAKTAMCR